MALVQYAGSIAQVVTLTSVLCARRRIPSEGALEARLTSVSCALRRRMAAESERSQDANQTSTPMVVFATMGASLDSMESVQSAGKTALSARNNVALSAWLMEKHVTILSSKG